MKVEYTGRHTTIHRHLQEQAAESLERIGKMLGRSATAHVILTEDKYRRIAEVTVTANGHSLVATCESAEMTAALHDALAKIEQQAIKQKDRFTTLKRHSKDERGALETAALPVKGGAKKVAARSAVKVSAARKSASMVVNTFRSKTVIAEPHVRRSIDSAAMRPMTFEEAVKEAATRDRDVFVFRDHQAQVMVLHRLRDGKVELIEVP
jgi:putative sigma-54 modulation protein